jgi:hypothetical protein
VGLGFEFRALPLELLLHSILLQLVCRWGSCKLFAWTGLKPGFSWFENQENRQDYRCEPLHLAFACFSFLLSCFIYFFFWDRVLLCRPSWPRSCYAPASTFWMLGLHMYITTCGSTQHTVELRTKFCLLSFLFPTEMVNWFWYSSYNLLGYYKTLTGLEFQFF